MEGRQRGKGGAAGARAHARVGRTCSNGSLRSEVEAIEEAGLPMAAVRPAGVHDASSTLASGSNCGRARRAVIVSEQSLRAVMVSLSVAHLTKVSRDPGASCSNRGVPDEKTAEARALPGLSESIEDTSKPSSDPALSAVAKRSVDDAKAADGFGRRAADSCTLYAPGPGWPAMLRCAESHGSSRALRLAKLLLWLT